MEMEKKEASSWDTTKGLRNFSQEAELVIGTSSSVYYVDTKGKYDADFKQYRQKIIKKFKINSENKSDDGSDDGSVDIQIGNINGFPMQNQLQEQLI